MTDIKTLIAARAATDPRLKAVLKKIKAGTATFKDTAYYAEVYSNITGSVFGANVLDLEGIEREEVCMELLRDNYEEINTICAQVQTALDQAAGIHIRPQKAQFPLERVEQIAHSLLDPTVTDSTIKRRANTGVANVSKGFHDSYIKVNASFRNDAGLKVYINRETDGKCCEWCSKIAGRYVYGSEPDDVYRRHDNCGCTTTYEDGKQRQDVWSKRSWTSPEVGAGAPSPTRFTPEQAAEVQARNMPTVLTNGVNNGKISLGSDNMAEITKLGKIDTQPLEQEFGKLKTDEIIVTNERLEHIKSRHPEDYSLFEKYGAKTVESPDIIIKDLKNENTVFMVKSLDDTNLNVVAKLILDTDESDYKNSVMTFYRIRNKNLVKLEKKNKTLYKKE